MIMAMFCSLSWLQDVMATAKTTPPSFCNDCRVPTPDLTSLEIALRKCIRKSSSPPLTPRRHSSENRQALASSDKRRLELDGKINIV